MLPQVAKLGGMALDFLFPQWCIGCGQEGDAICPTCCHSLPRVIPPLCPRCGQPQANGILCSKCSSRPAEIDGIRSPFRFDGLARQAIHQLKYNNLRTLATPLSRQLDNYITKNPVPGEVLVPVPLHDKRLRQRGYNQSALLARQLSKLTDMPMLNDCLVRQKYAHPQAMTASAAERETNVARAFSCRHSRLLDKQVLLIDDVATSGATLNACAAALKAAGATSVWGLVLALET